MDKQITIIIPTLNRPKLLLGLLRQLEREFELIFEVIVVNTSNTDNLKIPNLSFPIFIIREINLLSGKNLALRRVKTLYTLVLDDDLILSTNSVKKLFQFIQKKELDAASGLLLENKKYPLFLNPPYLKFTFYKLAFINSKNVYEGGTSADFLPGGFMLAKTKILLKLCGWDTNFIYPFYNEDTDLTFRMKNAGYRISYTLNSKAFHIKARGGVRKKLDHLFFYAFGFNNSYYFIKNFGKFYYLLYCIFGIKDFLFVVRKLNFYYIVEYIRGIIYGAKKAKSFNSTGQLQTK